MQMHILGWAFGEARLADLTSAMHDAALRARYLSDVPMDQDVRAELAKNLTGIARQGERLQLASDAALARRLARALHSPQAGPAVATQVRDGCDALEHRLTALVARGAGQRRERPVERLA
jgi:DNA-binding phage protein